MNKIASSPLKLILFGEHSVLIGGRCISLCINRYCTLYLSVNIKKDETLKILVKDIKNSKFIFSLGKEPKVENCTLDHNGLINIGYHLGCGLGSSAAISLLSAAALYQKRKIDFYDGDVNNEIFRKADLLEDVFHGISSGVDCATLRSGGLISFKEGKVKRMSTEHICKYKIIIFNSKIPKDTAMTIKQDLNNKDINYKKLSQISEEAYYLISKDFNLDEFYKLVRKAEDIFEDLGVVPDKMKEEVRKLRKMGIESKITGAGNGGHLFTLVDKEFNFENWEEVKVDYNGFLLN